jgi:hypothetical protein
MSGTKRTIQPTGDNLSEYLPDDYALSLAKRLTVAEDGIDRDSRIVTRLLAWNAHASGLSSEVRYEMSRHDAAVLPQQLAGWHG